MGKRHFWPTGQSVSDMQRAVVGGETPLVMERRRAGRHDRRVAGRREGRISNETADRGRAPPPPPAAAATIGCGPAALASAAHADTPGVAVATVPDSTRIQHDARHKSNTITSWGPDGRGLEIRHRARARCGADVHPTDGYFGRWGRGMRARRSPTRTAAGTVAKRDEGLVSYAGCRAVPQRRFHLPGSPRAC